MALFQNSSLRRKQTSIMMLTSSVALLLACAAFIAYDTATFRGKLVESVEVLAEVIGSNCAAALDFSDPKAARETLAALHANANIVSACVYTQDGEIFAVYRRDMTADFVPPDRRVDTHTFTRHRLHLFRAIQRKAEIVGTIMLESDLKDLSSRLARYIGIVGVVFLASLLLAFILSRPLQRLVSEPILQLASVARAVAQEKNYAVRAQKRSNDELGELVDGFNEMLGQIQARDTALEAAREDRDKRTAERAQELETIHKQLVDASRRSGMAEIATNVLHNVGNVLNSVNVSAGLVTERVKKARTSNLGRVVTVLREHEHDLGAFITQDARGKHLPAYLAELATQLTEDQEAIQHELDLLRRNIEHIKEIVAMQQSYATFGGVKETVDLVSVVEDSLHMNEEALTRHRVTIVRDFSPVPPTSIEKHKILQILVNLLRNAKHACEASNRPERRITVRVSSDAEHVRVAVGDNGVGIPRENLTRIFNHGFTTKKQGHGFGLHSGALAATEMGGSLTVQSEGPGCGSTFTLELPFNPVETVA